MTNKFHISLIIMFSCFIATKITFGQGWEQHYGGISLPINYDDFAESVLFTVDEGFLLTGGSESFGLDQDLDAFVVRTDQDGNQIWANIYDPGWNEYLFDAVETPHHTFMMCGYISLNPGDEPNGYMLEINNEGQLLWWKEYLNPGLDHFVSVINANDEGYLFLGHLNDPTNDQPDLFILKTDEQGNEIWNHKVDSLGQDIAGQIINTELGYAFIGTLKDNQTNYKSTYVAYIDNEGNQIWSKTYAFATNTFGNSLTTTIDGNMAITGYQVDPSTSSQGYIAKLNIANGDIIWHQTIGGDLTDECKKIVQTENGKLIVTGITELNEIDLDVFIAGFDQSGNNLWVNTQGEENHTDWCTDITPLGNEGYAVSGYYSLDPLFGFHDMSLFRTDSIGNIYSNHITGHVFFDSNNNCTLNNDEDFLSNWIVEAKSQDQVYYGTSNSLGYYSLLVDTGSYSIKILPKNPYWLPCVDVYENVTMVNSYDSVYLNFPMQSQYDCPFLSIQVSAPFAESCAELNYAIQYCNQGTQNGTNLQAIIELDQDLEYIASTIGLTSQTNNELTFDLPDLQVGQCENFIVKVSSECASLPLASYQVTANIIPQNDCLPISPNWDMSSVAVGANCETDSIKFTVSNIGTQAMTESKEYVIIEDQVMLNIEPFDLGSGESIEVKYPANGSTYRIIAEQVDGHPGYSYPTIAIEGCLESNITNPSLGFINNFQEDNLNQWTDIDQLEVGHTAQIQSFPNGTLGTLNNDSLFVRKDDQLKFKILTQNLSNVAVHRVVIRDTINLNTFDISSLKLGAASHPYSYQLISNNVLKIIFDDIILLPNQYIFVNFTLSSKQNIPPKTKISNKALISIGYQQPIQTPEKILYIGGDQIKDFITIDILDSSIETYTIDFKLKYYPNPWINQITIEIPELLGEKVSLNLYDQNANLIQIIKYDGHSGIITLNRNHIPAGIYWFSLQNDKQIHAKGKIIITN